MKMSLVKKLAIENYTKLHYSLLRDDKTNGKLILRLNTQVSPDADTLGLNDVSGVKVIALRGLLSQFNLSLPQYVEYELLGDNDVLITIKTCNARV